MLPGKSVATTSAEKDKDKPTIITEADLIPKDIPRWYRELSFEQMGTADGIIDHLKQDMFQGTAYRTMSALQGLGLYPLVSSSELIKVMQMSGGNDLAFLWFLYRAYYCKDVDRDCEYIVNYKIFDMNEQIILSVICHLDMVTTLRKLDKILPKNPKKKNIIEKTNQKKKKVPKVYPSPYLEPVHRWKPPPRKKNNPVPPGGLSFEPYDVYRDPYYVVKNEASRWFAEKHESLATTGKEFSYLRRASRRIVDTLVRREIDKLFKGGVPICKDRDKLFGTICTYHTHMEDIKKELEIVVNVVLREKRRALISREGKKIGDRARINNMIEREIKKYLESVAVFRSELKLDSWIKSLVSEILIGSAPEDRRRKSSTTSAAGDRISIAPGETEKQRKKSLEQGEGQELQEEQQEDDQLKRGQNFLLREEAAASIYQQSRFSGEPGQNNPEKDGGDKRKSDQHAVRKSQQEGAQQPEKQGQRQSQERDKPRQSQISQTTQRQSQVRPSQMRESGERPSQERQSQERQSQERQSQERQSQQRQSQQQQQRRASARSSVGNRGNRGSSCPTGKDRLQLLQQQLLKERNESRPDQGQDSNCYEDEDLPDKYNFAHFSKVKRCETFFQAPGHHKPYKFHYNKIFKDELKDKSNPIKRAVYRALDLDNYFDEDDAVFSIMKEMWNKEVKIATEKIEKKEKAEEAAKVKDEIWYDPRDDELMTKLLFRAIQRIRKNPKFVLASLPNAHNVPVLKQWIRARYGIIYTYQEQEEGMARARALLSAWRKYRFKKEPPAPTPSALKEPVDCISFRRKPEIVSKCEELKKNFFTEAYIRYMEDTMMLWNLMDPFHWSATKFRSTFFAYMPATVYNVVRTGMKKSQEPVD